MTFVVGRSVPVNNIISITMTFKYYYNSIGVTVQNCTLHKLEVINDDSDI